MIGSRFYGARVLLLTMSIIACFNVRADSNDVCEITPPQDATVEQWDWYSSTLMGNKNGFKLDVAIYRDSIYFRLVDSGFLPYPIDDNFCVDSWIHGVIKGDKVVIDRSQRLNSYKLDWSQGGPDYGEFKGYKYFNACRATTYNMAFTGQHYHYYLGVRTIDKDIIFDYDPIVRCLNNPDEKIWVSSYIEDEAGWMGYDAPMLPGPVYLDFELMYVPDGPLTPQPPKFYRGKDDWDKEDQFVLNGSIISKEGPAMHFYDLDYRIYLDGEPYVMYDDEGNPYTDIHMNYKGASTRRGLAVGSCTVPFKPFKEAYAVMVYKYEDGAEVVSEPAPLVDISVVDEVFGEEPEDVSAPVYDLSGRRVKPDRHAPGVFIRNGRKFMVR